MRSSLFLGFLLATALPATGATQATPDTTRALQRAMASDLRNLVVAQEAHFAQHSRYAPDVATLGAGYKTSAGNSARLVNAEANRYGAEIRAAGYNGTCVISIGLAEEQAARTALERKAYPEGEPACDGDGETEATRRAAAAQFAATRVLGLVAKLQERHFGKTGAYATSVDQLTGFRAHPQVTVTLEVTPAGGRMEGYLAIATHAKYAATSCVMRSGIGLWMDRARTAAERKRATGEMMVMCDTFK